MGVSEAGKGEFPPHVHTTDGTAAVLFNEQRQAGTVFQFGADRTSIEVFIFSSDDCLSHALCSFM